MKVLLDELVPDAPLERKSWDDVVARARGAKRRRLALPAVVIAVASILVATPAFGIGSRLLGIFDGTPIPTERLSAEEAHVLGAMASGVSPRVPASEREDLARLGAASLRQIAERDGRAFFVAERRGGGVCVSIDSTGDDDVLGGLLCSPDFPSAARPILDRSTFRGSPTSPSVNRLEGFAANGVSAVGLLTADGSVTGVTPVEDNVYLRTEGLPADPISAVVALDADGNRLYSQCFVAAGCPKQSS
jgi:hypothetical protein